MKVQEHPFFFRKRLFSFAHGGFEPFLATNVCAFFGEINLTQSGLSEFALGEFRSVPNRVGWVFVRSAGASTSFLALSTLQEESVALATPVKETKVQRLR